MKKINIAKFLANCPTGMELDCTMFENVTFVRVDMNKRQFPIEIAVSGIRSKYLTKEGCFHDITLLPESKCVIFPKGKTTWEGFQRPFNDGDILVGKANQPFIFKSFNCGDGCYSYCGITADEQFCLDSDDWTFANSLRFATEEEKEKLYKVIKNHGYTWNAETKTLEKLIELKFKLGDKIRKKGESVIHIVAGIIEDRYILDNKDLYLLFENQDECELIPNKFDITTLKPFDRVLVRNTNKDYWRISMFGYIQKGEKQYFMCIANSGFYQCVPYENNEHLLGTTDASCEFYKTWED